MPRGFKKNKRCQRTRQYYREKNPHNYYYLLPYYKHMIARKPKPQHIRDMMTNNSSQLSKSKLSKLSKFSVLLAKKRCFNQKDGFIHTNPGQMVICGGKVKNDASRERNHVINNAIVQFYKQTGHILRNKSNITHFFRNKNKYFVYYNVTDINEYDNLTRLDTNGAHSQQRYKQIKSLQWVTIRTASQLFSSIKHNQPCGGDIEEYIGRYINFVIDYGTTPHTEFEKFETFLTVTGSNTNIRKKKTQILQDILKNRSQSPFFPLIRGYVRWYILNRCDVDWFENAITVLSKLLFIH